MDNKKLRIEILTATPPTKKCKKLIKMMKSFEEKYPEKVRIDIYYAGTSPDKTPTKGYQSSLRSKRVRIPASFINGEQVSQKELPEDDKVKSIIENEIKKGPKNWQE